MPPSKLIDSETLEESLKKGLLKAGVKTRYISDEIWKAQLPANSDGNVILDPCVTLQT